MENIKYNGVEGVFIPNKEFEYIKQSLNKNNILINRLLQSISEENRQSI